MKIAFVSGDEYYKSVFDIEYLNTICNINYYKLHQLKVLYKDIKGNDIDLIIFSEIFRIYDSNSELFLMINEIRKISKVRMLSIDVNYPSRDILKENEINKRKEMVILADSYVGGLDNSIDVPMLGALNFDNLHFNILNGRPTLKEFLMYQYPEFTDRTYDIICKLGKPKPLRILITLLLLKNKLNNLYTNISFSRESSMNTPEELESYLRECRLDSIIEEFGLYRASKELLIGSYLGSTYSKNKINFSNKRPSDYNVDFNSYAEIYTESITCELDTIKVYPDLVAFTEKTFNNFFDFKIPLPIDTKINIDYLKKIGFQFPIEPCYIESDDTLDELYVKINKWIKNLKQYDFKKMWNEWFYDAPFESPLHINHKLIVEFMQTRRDYTGFMKSKPQYIATYKLLERFYPDMVSNYKDWDNQTYLFLKRKELL